MLIVERGRVYKPFLLQYQQRLTGANFFNFFSAKNFKKMTPLKPQFSEKIFYVFFASR